MRFIFAWSLVCVSHAFASASDSIVAPDQCVVDEEAPLIRARMGFDEITDQPGAYMSKVLVLDNEKNAHMQMVVAALSQTSVLSQITQCDHLHIQGLYLETFFETFAQEQFDVVNISLSGYHEEEHDFAFLYAMARQFPQTHFVLAIGNHGEARPHYPYPKVCEELLETVKHQLTFAIWSEKRALEQPSTGSYLPQEMSMPMFYTQRSLLAPGDFGAMGGSSFAAPRIAGCIARLKEVYGVTPNEAASFLHTSADRRVGYTPARYGNGRVNYTQAALLAAAHTPSLTPEYEAPDFGRFMTDYHTFQCLAASKNVSNFILAFQNPDEHFMTHYPHAPEEGRLCQIDPEDLSGLLTSLENTYLAEKITFDQFAHTLLDSPLYRDYPGCASYMFLKHYQNVDEDGNPKAKDYPPCATEAQHLCDLFELAAMSRKDGHLDLSMACLERLQLAGAWEKAEPAYEQTLLEYEASGDPVLKYWLDMGQCVGTYAYFDNAKIMSYLDDLGTHYGRLHGRFAGYQVLYGVIQRLAASLRTQLATARAPGNPHFMLMLAKNYEGGLMSLRRDMEQAAAWYERIFEIEDAPQSIRDHAQKRIKHIGTRNTKVAFKYFEDLAKQGS